MVVAGALFLQGGPHVHPGPAPSGLLGGRDSYCRIKMVRLLLLNRLSSWAGTVIRLVGVFLLKVSGPSVMYTQVNVFISAMLVGQGTGACHNLSVCCM